MSIQSSVPTEAAARHPWLAVSAVGLATFSVVTTEMLPVGLLTSIAAALGSSTGDAGWLISLPAMLAAVSAPLVVIAAGALDRRLILRALLGLLLLANLASALAPNMAAMLMARALVGLCMGGIWAIAGGLAARLVSECRVGLATSIIFGGVAAASVLGVPLGTLIGDAYGWRAAFAGMSLLSGLVLLLHLGVIPALPVARGVSMRMFLQQLGNRALQRGLLLTLLLVAGHFMVFTFVRPLLDAWSGVGMRWMGPLLFAYGVAGIAGNFLMGPLAARWTRPAVTAISVGLLLTPLLWLSAGTTFCGAIWVLLLWGLAYGGVSVGLMTWMMKATPRAMEVAGSLYVGVFNIGIAAGAWAGGWLLDHNGITGNLWVAAALALAALLACIGARTLSGSAERLKAHPHG
ncbi:transporter [Stenotrophomonas humi]|uniref:Transporter n=1 Tax=Stenotrophomonas humi TaxID=405444 RepID=A0A0R0C6J8_9GAMM|nr:MFS transporter [Stenotrophomonas humi]KRG62178.1 transporter [Stenotrophomonas humi]